MVVFLIITFFAFLLAFVDDFAVYSGSKLSIKLLSSVPVHKKAVMCLMRKIHVFDKLRSGMSYGTLGHKFNINDSTIYIKQDVFKQKHKKILLIIIN